MGSSYIRAEASSRIEETGCAGCGGLIVKRGRGSSHLTEDDERDKAVFSGCICTDFDQGESSEAVGSGSSRMIL